MDTDKYVVAYYIHDVICNNEQLLTNFDADYLKAIADAGLIIVAVYNDESREQVAVDDVREPEPHVNGITLATPSYVDARTVATVAVFDALATIIDPESAVATADETGETTEAVDPVETFKAALAELRKLESCEVAQ